VGARTDNDGRRDFVAVLRCGHGAKARLHTIHLRALNIVSAAALAMVEAEKRHATHVLEVREEGQ